MSYNYYRCVVNIKLTLLLIRTQITAVTIEMADYISVPLHISSPKINDLLSEYFKILESSVTSTSKLD